MSDSFAEELQVALHAVRDASAICQAVQAQISPDSLEKKDRSPVTIADFASQAAVCRAIGDAFPDDPIIAEEDSAFLRDPENAEFLAKVQAAVSGRLGGCDAEQVLSWVDRGGASGYSPRFWTLDPIDGTKGFLRKEQYAVSLALIVDGVIQLGVLGCPNLPVAIGGQNGALFSAIKGQGSRVQPLEPENALPQVVRVNKTVNASEARVCESVESGHSSHSDSAMIASKLGITNDPVRLDSQAKYAVVARGEADIYLRLPTRKDYRERIWDHAGGVILVEEAGGRVSDVDGKPLDFTQGQALEQNRGVIVANANLHEQVMSVVQEVLDSGESTT
ncbi:MAG: 3'(2'),5'-bisphosphate nucleotidase [Planctomycetaceae bacterium]|nr:3'(2'),5'-bisphosphate nucleotidase [Planctomycetaceae bacterium]